MDEAVIERTTLLPITNESHKKGLLIVILSICREVIRGDYILYILLHNFEEGRKKGGLHRAALDCLEMKPNFRRQRPRRHIMRAAERGEEVV